MKGLEMPMVNFLPPAVPVVAVAPLVAVVAVATAVVPLVAVGLAVGTAVAVSPQPASSDPEMVATKIAAYNFLFI
jgi:hypothetical protein